MNETLKEKTVQTLKNIAVALCVAVAIGFAPRAQGEQAELRYLEPVYKDLFHSTSGIDHWVTNSLAAGTYTPVTDNGGAQSWGESGKTNWYVVSGADVVITGGVTCAGHVRLILSKGAKLTITNVVSNCAGIQTDGVGSFVICETPESLDASPAQRGAIRVFGGVDGAGIGGGYKGEGKYITINGGTVAAYGGSSGAGIGSGCNANDGSTNEGRDITVNGGAVTATGGNGAAGIGGGSYGDGRYVVVNGGTVTAMGGEYGAGIGGGQNCTGARVTVNGGMVTAMGGSSAAGIGGGNCSHGSVFAFNGGTVTATGGKGGAGIGGGLGENGTWYEFCGGTVTATGGDEAAGIGGGRLGLGAQIEIKGGTVTATGGYHGAGIGGGKEAMGTNIVITGGIVRATGGSAGAGLGGGKAAVGADVHVVSGLVFVASAQTDNSEYHADLIGNGGDCDEDAATPISVSADARVFFNVTGLRGFKSSQIFEPSAAMPSDFEGFTIMTRGTQTVSRVLVNGSVGDAGGSGPHGVRALPWVLTNAVDGVTSNVSVGAENEIAFAKAFCSVVETNGTLSLVVRQPSFAITRQPSEENDYRISASTDGNGGIVNYTWCDLGAEVTDYATLTNTVSTGEMLIGKVTPSGVNSTYDEDNGSHKIMMIWEVENLPTDSTGDLGTFRFTCEGQEALQTDLLYHTFPFGKLTYEGNGQYSFKTVSVMGMLCGIVLTNATSFTITNLRYEIPVVGTTVGEGATMTQFPAGQGTVGSNYICRVTYEHEGLRHVGYSDTFTLEKVLPVSITAKVDQVEHATATVYTNGVASTKVDGKDDKWHAWADEPAYVVYTADEGYRFADGTTVQTNTLDTTANPATVVGDPPVSERVVGYRSPVYKGTDGNPTNGIARWETLTVPAGYTVVASAASRVTWGAAGATNWYVVANGEYRIDGGVTCAGHVRLVLCDGARLTVTNAAANYAGIQTDTNGSFTVYAQPGDTGALLAYGGQEGAGIGGGNKGTGKNITINGGTVTATGGKEGAGIGGGEGAKGTGGRAGAGTDITINGGTVMAAGGAFGAGIGGGSMSLASDITINGGIVTATGGKEAAGVGGGGSEGHGHASGITINGGLVTATGGHEGSGIGGGINCAGSDIHIVSGTVFVATAGCTLSAASPDLIGNGAACQDAASGVTVSPDARVFFNLTGLYDMDDGDEEFEAVAAMPTECGAFTVMTRGTQTVSRVLIGGFAGDGGGPRGARALPWVLTNAVDGATSNVNVGVEITFAKSYCRIDEVDGALTYVARPPQLTVSQQPGDTNDYTIAATTDGNNGITNYAWHVESMAVLDFVALTNRMEKYGSICSVVTSAVESEQVDGVDTIMLVWPVGNLTTGDSEAVGTFRFTSTEEGLRASPYYGYDFGSLTYEGDGQYSFKPVAVMGTYYGFYLTNATPFTITNLRYEVASVGDEPLAEGPAMKQFPTDKGTEGSNYLCRVTYGHEGIYYTKDSDAFTFTKAVGKSYAVVFAAEPAEAGKVAASAAGFAVASGDSVVTGLLVTVSATVTNLNWQFRAWTVTNGVGGTVSTTGAVTSAENAFTMPESPVFAYARFTVSDACRAAASNAVEEAYAAATNAVGRQTQLTDDEKEEYLDELGRKRQEGLDGIAKPDNDTPQKVGDEKQKAIDELNRLETLAKAGGIRIGEDVWATVSNGVCTVVGTGDTWSFASPTDSLLWAHRSTITNLVISGDVTGIGTNLFAYMKRIRYVTVGDGVTNIAARAFFYCVGIREIALGANVAHVGENAFERCNSLTTIRLSRPDVAGLDAAFKVTARITMKGDVPFVDTVPVVEIAGYTQTLQGKVELSDENWVTIDPANIDPKYHFFRIVFEN